jgi:hypothetical protein
MAKWTIYDYKDERDGNLMCSWSKRLQKKERAKLNNRIDALAMHGTDLIPGIVAPTGTASIFKLKVHGKVQLRPMLCEGPGKGEPEFTFLLGAKEIQFTYDPPGAPETAAELRENLVKNPKLRCEHERVG